MGNTGGVIKAFDCAWENPEAFPIRRFFAVFKEALQAQADSEEWHARPNAGDESLTDVHFVKGAQHLAEVAHSRKDDLGSPLEARGIGDEFVAGADFIEGVLNGTK